MTLEALGVGVWDQFVPTLDSRSNERGHGGMHPRFDHFTNQIIFRTRLVTVDGKARAVHTELDPTNKMLRGRLRTFESANIMTVALIMLAFNSMEVGQELTYL